MSYDIYLHRLGIDQIFFSTLAFVIDFGLTSVHMRIPFARCFKNTSISSTNVEET